MRTTADFPNEWTAKMFSPGRWIVKNPWMQKIESVSSYDDGRVLCCCVDNLRGLDCPHVAAVRAAIAQDSPE